MQHCPNHSPLRRPGPPRTASLAITVILGLALIGVRPVHAETVIAVSCYGLKSHFGGVDTRLSASQCRTAGAKAGYASSVYSSTADMADVFQRLPADAIVHVATHALTAGVPAVGQAMVLEPSTTEVDLLAGDLKYGPTVQGPVTVCSSTGDCDDVTAKTAPWATELAKYNLVMLMGCKTAATGNTLYSSIADVAYSSGAGTVIGWKQDISFPISYADAYGNKWARVFYDNAEVGVTYTTSAVRATQAHSGNGLSSYRILRNTGAPTRMTNPSYYVMGVGAVSEPDAVAVAAAAHPNARSAAIAELHGGAAPVLDAWTPVTSDSGNDAFRAYRAGFGLFELEAQSDTLLSAVWENSQGPMAGTTPVTVATALKGLGLDTSGMILREVVTLDHEAFVEKVFRWQRRDQATGAWMPERIEAAVTPDSGRLIGAYRSDPASHGAPVIASPRYDPVAAAGPFVAAGHRVASVSDLEMLVEPDGTIRTGWHVTTEGARTLQAGYGEIPDGDTFFVDASTGSVELVASQ